MSYEKGKPGSKKEVRNMSKERKQQERQELVNYLTCKWSYANNTSYCKQFRKYKLIEMINEITFFLHDEESGQSLLLKNEQFLLLSLIRAISDVLDEGKNKRLVENRLKAFTELSE